MIIPIIRRRESKIMSKLAEQVTLREVATTYEGLRAQASLLGIVGRGAMRKPQLIEAVTDALNALHTDYEAARQDVEAQRREAGMVPAPEVLHIEVHPDVATVIKAALEYNGTRTTGRRGASLLMTREGRKDYPASSRARMRKAKRRGRK